MTREEFMEAYRNDDELKESMTPEDCKEIFLTVLQGDGDINKGILDDLLREYGIDDTRIIVFEHSDNNDD